MGLLTFTALSLSFASAAGAPPALPALPPITHYVAPETGSDAANGLTAGTAWRNPPGSAAATGAAAAYTAQPGDHVGFKGGERWHGRLPSPAGTPESPIIYSGNAWGSGRCLMDGASQTGITVRAATSQADAGGNANWANAAMRVVEWTDDSQPTWLYDATGGLVRAQSHRATDPYAFDVADAAGKHFEISSGGLSGLALSFLIDDATLANHVRADVGRALLWIKVDGASYVQRLVIGVVGNVVEVEHTSFGSLPYTDGNQAIFAHDCAPDVTAPGDWALLSATKALVWTRGSLMIRRGAWTGNPNVITPAANTVVRGFEITGHADNGAAAGTNAPGLFIRGSGMISGWKFLDNWVHDNRLHAGGGSQMISLSNISDAEITHNRFEKHYPRAGAVVTSAPNVLVAWNIFHRITATALRVFAQTGYDVVGIRVHHNIISSCKGVHSNGIAIYQATNDVECDDNAVFDNPRPLTVQGTCLLLPRKIRGNLFMADADGNGWAFWVNSASGVPPVNLPDCEFSRNINISWAAGMLLKSDMPRLRLLQNWSTVGSVGGADGTYRSMITEDNQDSWTQAGNVAIANDYLETVGGVVQPDLINVLRPDGTRLVIDLRAVAA